MRFDEFKRHYLASSLLMRFIYINIAVFVVLRLVGLVSFLGTGSSNSLLQWLELPAYLPSLLHRPWTVFTYMFSHYGLLHILFNMLWLYWLGRIFLEFFTPRQLGGLYVLGGLGGAALFIAAYNLLPHLDANSALMLGASASVMAIVIAVSVYRPDYQINLLFIGGISLKWVAIVTVLLDLISIEGGNMGGHIAHIGGMLVGLWFGLAIKRGHDITSWINWCIDAFVTLFSKRPSNKAWRPIEGDPLQRKKAKKTKANKAKTADTKAQPSSSLNEERLDEILGKLKRSGYGALSDEEKEFLFNASRKR